MELKHYFQALARRKWIIILTVVVTMIVVGIGTYTVSPVYEANTVVRVAAAEEGLLNYIELTYAQRLMNTYVEIATSRPVMDELKDRLNLPTVPQILVEAIPNTELIRITVTDADPVLTARVANTMAEILIEQSNQLYTGGTRTSQDIWAGHLAQAKSDLDQTQKEYDKLAAKPTPIPQQLDAMRQTLQLQQNIYESLRREYDLASFRQEIQSTMVTIVELGIVPEKPIFPDRNQYYVFGLILGLIAGIGLALIFENLDHTLYTTQSIENAAGLTALAKIPYSTHLEVGQKTDSPLDEAFRGLAANLRLAIHPSDRKVLALISAEPQQGKSSLISNLAVSLAEFEESIVVVDCDLRFPKVHSLFGLSNEIGLQDVVKQKKTLDQVLQKTSVKGVMVLASGESVEHPSLLLGSDQLTKLLQELKERFDYVLIDSPSLLAVSDGAVIARNVDGLIQVVRREHAKGESVEAVKRFLADFSDKYIGLIVNQAEKNQSFNYYRAQKIAYRQANPSLKSVATD